MEKIQALLAADRKLHRLHMQCSFKMLSQDNIHSGQPPILGYLSRHVSANQCHIAQHLGISRASIGKSLERMEKDGLVCRKPASDDTRYMNVELTPKGDELAKKSIDQLISLHMKEIEGFSESELDTLLNFYNRMTQNLEKYKSELSEKE